jgi:uncharacterized protein (TIGR02147 family)
MDYRDLIKAEFARRRGLNSFYSLRTFAKDLGLTPMHLSYLFRGKRGLSKLNALAVAKGIGLRTFAAKRFCLMVSAQSGRSKVERNVAKQGFKKKFIQEAEPELVKRLEN